MKRKGHYELKRDRRLGYFMEFVASNGKIVWITSESYKTKRSAIKAYEAIAHAATIGIGFVDCTRTRRGKL